MLSELPPATPTSSSRRKCRFMYFEQADSLQARGSVGVGIPETLWGFSGDNLGVDTPEGVSGIRHSSDLFFFFRGCSGAGNFRDCLEILWDWALQDSLDTLGLGAVILCRYSGVASAMLRAEHSSNVGILWSFGTSLLGMLWSLGTYLRTAALDFSGGQGWGCTPLIQ